MNEERIVLNAVIADDEAPSRNLLKKFIAEHRQTRLVGEAATGNQALTLIRERLADIAFLDIRMPRGCGFKVVENLDQKSLLVVFITAYDQFAVRAFDTGAFDYLLKPFDQERVFRTLDQACLRLLERRARKEKLGRREAAGAASQAVCGPFTQRLMFKEKGRIYFQPVDRIRWISAEGVYVRIHVDGGQHLVRRSLAEMSACLDPARFCRIHRSTIVNLDEVASMKPAFHGDYSVHLKSGDVLRMSRTYRDRVLEPLNGS